jgi:hypothetical protein
MQKLLTDNQLNLTQIDLIKGIAILILCIACSGSRNSDETYLKEAIIIHNRMIEKAEQLSRELDAIEMQPIMTISVDSIKAIKVALMEWENDLVEVPGNESEQHNHKQGSHSHHDVQPEVTAEQLLIIQQELKQQLDKIEARVNFWSTKKLK